jgi:hypothetical protein
MKSKHRFIQVLMFGILLVIPSTIVRSQTEGELVPELFKPTVSSAKAYAVFAEEVRSRTVLVDVDMLIRLGWGDTLNLNLFEDEMYLGQVERINRRAEDCATIAGRLDGLAHSSFIFVREKEAVVGIIRTGLLGELHQLRYIGESQHLISQINPSLYPPEEDPISADTWDVNAVELQPEPVDSEMSSKVKAQSNGCSLPQPVFDVLIPYTHLARQAMGGTNAAIAQCQLAIEVSNEAYDNSQIYARMRLVHCMEVYYNEGGDPNDWLTWVTYSPLVQSTRNTYAADFVCMLTAGGSGLGYCRSDAPKAFSVAQWARAVNTRTMAHEIGHNQGCNHNREDASENCSISSYSYGWHFIGDTNSHWGTVMSYPGNRIAHFSNPDVYFDGQPTGVPIGQEGEAHNALVIRLRTGAVEAFRLTRYDIWVDFDWTFYERGTYSEPYNSVAEGALTLLYAGTGASEEPTLWIKAGSTDETPTLSKPMVIRACGGIAQIGQSP